MGAASGEGVGRRRAAGELQAEAADAESEDGGVESNKDVGDQDECRFTAAPQSRYSHRRK